LVVGVESGKAASWSPRAFSGACSGRRGASPGQTNWKVLGGNLPTTTTLQVRTGLGGARL
jgi:hypothetical protein